MASAPRVEARSFLRQPLVGRSRLRGLGRPASSGFVCRRVLPVTLAAWLGGGDSAEPQPFSMLAREVSIALFADFEARSGHPLPKQPFWATMSGQPVVNVTWDEAQAFCSFHGGRLPTSAEWEHAARAGGPALAPFPRGDTFSGAANLAGRSGADRWTFTAPVGSFPPNALGFYDLVGNVWEWTEDVHETATPVYDVRSVRGASWDNAAARLPLRAGLSRLGRHNLYVGFRCVR